MTEDEIRKDKRHVCTDSTWRNPEGLDIETDRHRSSRKGYKRMGTTIGSLMHGYVMYGTHESFST